MAWTDEQRETVVELWKESNPTPENSAEVLKEIAEEVGQTPNGVRMILVSKDLYIKKAPASPASPSGGSKGGRVSKEAQIASLKTIIEDNGLTLEEEILSKLTGKAAAYFCKVLEEAVNPED